MLQLGRNDRRYREADHLLRCISKQLLRSRIPTGYNAIQVLADDCIIGTFHDHCQSALSFLSFFSGGHVGGCSEPLRNVALIIEQRHGSRKGPAERSIDTANSMLEFEHALVFNGRTDRL